MREVRARQEAEAELKQERECARQSTVQLRRAVEALYESLATATADDGVGYHERDASGEQSAAIARGREEIAELLGCLTDVDDQCSSMSAAVAAAVSAAVKTWSDVIVASKERRVGLLADGAGLGEFAKGEMRDYELLLRLQRLQADLGPISAEDDDDMGNADAHAVQSHAFSSPPTRPPSSRWAHHQGHISTSSRTALVDATEDKLSVALSSVEQAAKRVNDQLLSTRTALDRERMALEESTSRELDAFTHSLTLQQALTEARDAARKERERAEAAAINLKQMGARELRTAEALRAASEQVRTLQGKLRAMQPIEDKATSEALAARRASQRAERLSRQKGVLEARVSELELRLLALTEGAPAVTHLASPLTKTLPTPWTSRAGRGDLTGGERGGRKALPGEGAEWRRAEELRVALAASRESAAVASAAAQAAAQEAAVTHAEKIEAMQQEAECARERAAVAAREAMAAAVERVLCAAAAEADADMRSWHAKAAELLAEQRAATGKAATARDGQLATEQRLEELEAEYTCRRAVWDVEMASLRAHAHAEAKRVSEAAQLVQLMRGQLQQEATKRERLLKISLALRAQLDQQHQAVQWGQGTSSTSLSTRPLVSTVEDRAAGDEITSAPERPCAAEPAPSSAVPATMLCTTPSAIDSASVDCAVDVEAHAARVVATAIAEGMANASGQQPNWLRSPANEQLGRDTADTTIQVVQLRSELQRCNEQLSQQSFDLQRRDEDITASEISLASARRLLDEQSAATAEARQQLRESEVHIPLKSTAYIITPFTSHALHLQVCLEQQRQAWLVAQTQAEARWNAERKELLSQAETDWEAKRDQILAEAEADFEARHAALLKQAEGEWECQRAQLVEQLEALHARGAAEESQMGELQAEVHCLSCELSHLSVFSNNLHHLLLTCICAFIGASADHKGGSKLRRRETAGDCTGARAGGRGERRVGAAPAACGRGGGWGDGQDASRKQRATT